MCARLIIMTLACALYCGCSSQDKPTTMPAATERRTPSSDGAALYRQYCASCHPDGGNVSDPSRTLRRSSLASHHITTADDIVRIMRNPISRMIRFDPASLPDHDARAIAEYILTTFK